MPKVITRYYCALCNREFKTRKEATDCEQNHLRIKKVVKNRETYDVNDRKKEYPTDILVELTNGQQIRYYRQEKI